MKRITEFKSFVRTRPHLINYVNNDKMTWQKFYELWDLYGADHEIWEQYQTEVETNPFAEIGQLIKGVNLDSVRRNIGTLQKGVNLVQELLKQDQEVEVSKPEPYTPRPLYRRFED